MGEKVHCRGARCSRTREVTERPLKDPLARECLIPEQLFYRDDNISSLKIFRRERSLKILV